MKQYNEIKEKHPNSILLFRIGDFYETFSDDAILASKILGITLTRRANGQATYVELAGFPYHSLDTYLPKLVRAGQRVAICEQLEDPKLTKKIVKRGVTELVTPGVALDDNILEHKENNFLASIHFGKHACGIAFLDISTGEFLCAEGSIAYLDKLISSFRPKEIIFERTKDKMFTENFGTKYYTYKLDDWIYTEEAAHERLLLHFQTNSLKGFGIEALPQGIIAAGSILHYLDLTEHRKLEHIRRISRIAEENYVWLDRFTARNLELFGSPNEGAVSLMDVIDRTVSPMGSRMLRRWVSLPLKNTAAIANRLGAVGYLLAEEDFRTDIQNDIKQMCDLERVISRVAAARISPRELVQLKLALTAITPIKSRCTGSADQMLQKIGEQLNPCTIIRDLLERQLQATPPNLVSKGEVIADGVDADLDELRSIAFSGKDYLVRMQEREEERTGITKIKIDFNSVFGYYIEVRNSNKDKVPPEWIRKQTLVNAERYITEELKEYESKIMGAEEKILAIETRLFNKLVQEVAEYIEAIQLNASLTAQLDCLLSFATVSSANRYVRPEVNDSSVITIINGRHPVIETQLPMGEEYVANSVTLGGDQQIIVITGPNMAGKSALLRQTALIVLLAQIGCFVPAESATIGYVDKIFTRVGASDNISSGESTFMVEMNEAASILNNISDRSLILFDELGRGTSTYDGISIAWSIIEYLHEHPSAKAKTLFATHYHELNDMAAMFERIQNFNVSIKEIDGKILFLRKLIPGGSEHSFGIHVAKLAGMPPSVINRANEVLADLEKAHGKTASAKPSSMFNNKSEPGMQLSFFQLEDPVLIQIKEQIHGIDINNLTPLEALNKLSEIKKFVGAK